MTGTRNQPTRFIAWGRLMLALLVVGILLVLGVANIALRAQSHQVEDGVLWADRAEGVTVAEIADRSPAARGGLQRGDVLLAVNGVPVERRADVVEYQNRGSAGTTLSYTVVRLGSRQVLQVELAPGPQGSSMYFVRAAAPSRRSGHAGLLLALRRLLRRIHVLLHRPA